MSRMILILVFAAIIGFTSASTSQCWGTCPATHPNDDVWLLPHEECAKYCSCVHGTPVEMPCPPGLHYSVKYRVCTDPYLAECSRPSDDV